MPGKDEGALKTEMEWKTIAGKEYLYFKFGVFLLASHAKEMTAQWKTELEKNPGRKVSIIWDCLEMKDYDNQARVVWQQAINETKDRIDAMWVITNNIFINIGANIIGAIDGVRINAVRGMDEIARKSEADNK